MNKTAQEAAIERLERQGWTFANWVSAHDAVDGADALMVRFPKHYRREYCEVMPDGTIA